MEQSNFKISHETILRVTGLFKINICNRGNFHFIDWIYGVHHIKQIYIKIKKGKTLKC